MQELVKIGNKTEESGKENKESELNKAIEVAKNILEKLKEYIGSLEKIGNGDNSKIGDVPNSNKHGASANSDELKIVYKALKGIVETAGEVGIEKPRSVSTAVTVGIADNKDGVRVLTIGNHAQAAAGDKSTTIVSTVSEKEILAAIIGSSEGDVTGTIGGAADATTSALNKVCTSI
ncbi:Variable major outer membrane lipoprotein (plasmid) [Borrelia coriaceae ATCC 43381]|uniref:Variable large protein n=1 Tax=Borrelia coriaceae ATCC 43381 TaxID=1408429 RepID=W5SXE0_9SPIR|nr:Variable major outer membrane lipoprotein [Borrelia coriaceae ATCC 43381]